jgi:hypothetical protein
MRVFKKRRIGPDTIVIPVIWQSFCKLIVSALIQVLVDKARTD